jgi:hypothetical protein
VGDQVELLVVHGDRLVTISVELQEDRETTYQIVETPNASVRALSLRDACLEPYVCRVH